MPDRWRDEVIDSDRLTRVLETEGRSAYREEVDREDPWLNVEGREGEKEDMEDDGAAKEDWDRDPREDEPEKEADLEE